MTYYANVLPIFWYCQTQVKLSFVVSSKVLKERIETKQVGDLLNAKEFQKEQKSDKTQKYQRLTCQSA